MISKLVCLTSVGALLVACGDDPQPTADDTTGGTETSGPGSTSTVDPDTGDSQSSGIDPASTTGVDATTTDPDSTTGPEPVCGNGVVEGFEKCDGDDLDGFDCLLQGFEGGELGCTADCKLDTSACFFFICGNGTVQGMELCDGDEVGGMTCLDLGFDSGALVCNDFCNDYNTDGCGECGNLVVDGDEICEVGEIPDTETCDLYGFDSGEVGCGVSCEIDTATCGICGNAIKDGAESCDGADFGGATCAGIGLGGGTLGCTPACTYDFSGCDDQFGIACDPAMPFNCFVGAFMADASGFSGNLYAMSLDGTQTINYGPLGAAVTGLAFHPNGTLYGVDPNTAQLGIVDPNTVSFAPVGTLQTAGGITHFNVPDIAFMGTQLIGWSENGDDLVLIDHTSGQVTVVTSPQGSFGTGMTYNSTTDEILLAPSGSNGTLYTVSAAGMVTPGPNLGGVQSKVKGLAFHNGLLYGFDTNFGIAGNFVTYNPSTGAMNVLGPAPSMNIDSIAIYDLGNLAAP
jgi:hypothetical protein